MFYDAKPGYFGFANEITVEADEACSSSALTMKKVNAFLEEAISSSCEGIMVKTLDDNSEYAPSKRSDAWLKLKRDYVEGLHETLDLVPIGAWYGNGRKAGWFSPFLLACYNPDCEEYQSVCRVMSGFTDAFYKEMSASASFSEEVERNSWITELTVAAWSIIKACPNSKAGEQKGRSGLQLGGQILDAINTWNEACHFDFNFSLTQLLLQMEEFFSGEKILTRKPAYYQTLEEPDIWFSPELVWEIRGADLTVSPVHQAAVGLVHPSRGISMRFPRFIRQRIDKNPENSSTPMEIADLFNHQTRKMKFGTDDQKSEQ
eukprot:Gb_13001 [translate_table: standard]